jgi:carboxypeptidase Q
MVRRTLLVLLVVALLPLAPAQARRPKPIDSEVYLTESMSLLLGRALSTDRAWEDLVFLCDRIGHRISGSPQLEVAIAWASERLAQGGLTNVHEEAVMVPRWVRGEESLTLLAPMERDLPMLGLGRSIGTGDAPIEAEVLVVSSFDELTARAAEAVGRIVLFDVPFTTYGETVQYRTRGAIAAARVGAVASLVRSVTNRSLQSPHTGAMRYDDDGDPPVPRIPHAAITVEDAETLHRLTARGVVVRVRLSMAAEMHDDVPSANVIGEVLGRERPDEVVVVGCHLDSWDVGQGAQDDGAGCVMAMEAGRLIAELPTAPRRTVRVVLYTNEENGLRGGLEYAEAHESTMAQHYAAIEADLGAGEPLGWRLDVRVGADDAAVDANWDAAAARLAPLLEALAPTGATALTKGGAGADVWPLTSRGVVGLGLRMETSTYWPIHHTHADTLDKIDPQVFRRNVAAMAITTLWLAEQDAPLVEPGQTVRSDD